MFCKNCGAEIKEGAKFCPKCGTKTGKGKTASPSEGLRLDLSGIQQFLESFSKQQLIFAGAAALVVILVFCITIKSAKTAKDPASEKNAESQVQENMAQETLEATENMVLENSNAAESTENLVQTAKTLTLQEQLALMKEYMDSLQVDKIEELLNTMVEQHINEPEMYLGLADLEIERGHADAAADMLIEGYQITKDEAIRNKLLDLQTRAEVGDETADKMERALNFAEDIADDLGYGDTVNKGKDIFNTIYGYYLDSKQ